AHDDAELELLLQAAQERLYPGQGTLDLGRLERSGARVRDIADWTGRTEQGDPDEAVIGRPRVVTGGGQVIGTSALVLWEALNGAYAHLARLVPLSVIPLFA